MSDAGWPASGTHQGACGQSSRACGPASTNAAPPSAGATEASQSHAPRTSASSHASASSMMRRAISTAGGWLPGARQSGSSPWPNPPSSLRYAATASRTGPAGPSANSRPNLRRSTTRA